MRLLETAFPHSGECSYEKLRPHTPGPELQTAGWIWYTQECVDIGVGKNHDRRTAAAIDAAMQLEKVRPERDDRLEFFQGFLRCPRQIASVVPSSRFLERRIARLASLEGVQTVVELGPGTGGTTRALLAAMPPQASLLSIEISPDFIAGLRAIEDHRLIVHHGNAERLAEILQQHAWASVDAVVSGIPFSLLQPEWRRRVVEGIWSALTPGGRFVAYQICGHIRQIAQPLFGPAQIALELRNFPPLRVYAWRKAEHGNSA
jgi:phosphatidylethanolamine/phosphatidyl-N-methylethanolamine N-methyltransferase